jgi:hypothetical protein
MTIETCAPDTSVVEAFRFLEQVGFPLHSQGVCELHRQAKRLYFSHQHVPEIKDWNNKSRVSKTQTINQSNSSWLTMLVAMMDDGLWRSNAAAAADET